MLRRARDDSEDFIDYLQAKRDRMLAELSHARNSEPSPSLIDGGSPAFRRGQGLARERGSRHTSSTALAGWVLAGLMVLVVMTSGGESTASSDSPETTGSISQAQQPSVVVEPRQDGSQPPETSSGDPEGGQVGSEAPRGTEGAESTPQGDVGDTQPAVSSGMEADGAGEDETAITGSGEDAESDDFILPASPPGTTVVLPNGCTIVWSETGVGFEDCPPGSVRDAYGLAGVAERVIEDLPSKLAECLTGDDRCNLPDAPLVEEVEELLPEDVTEGLVPEELLPPVETVVSDPVEAVEGDPLEEVLS